MKGTRPRGADSATDHSLREELHASPKERAENLMITDLVRNDLGCVAQPASVSVEKLFDVETYPHVHQMVSTVRASLSRHRTVVDVIRATFPGGSQDRRTQAPFDGNTRRTRRRLPGHLFGRTWVHHPGSQDRPEHGAPYRDRDVA